MICKNPRLLREKQSIDWIEQLLQTPLPDHRKYCIWRILAPYLINVKHLSFDDSYDEIYEWLDKCNELRALDFDLATKIDDSLNRAADSGYLPISFDNRSKEHRTLKTDNKGLYNIIKTNHYSILQ
jgi:non-catalytic primase subunit PriX-like protein